MIRTVLIILVWLAATLSGVAQTNYVCLVCGKGPLTGHIWLHPRGAICDECNRLPDHCSICRLPVKNGDGHIKTGDGRLICRYDKADVILTADQARDLFEKTRDEVIDMYGRQFALRFPQVTVNVFDVDYWPEKGEANGLHKFGFAHTRKSGSGEHTHEVVMLSGRTREEMTAVAAHEYTHLWIWENCPENRRIDGDTVEAICELTAYKLMAQKKDAEMQKRILDNLYTNGKIRDLVAVEREGGSDYVLNWVKTGRAAQFESGASLAPLATRSSPVTPITVAPRVLPLGLKFTGTMAFGKAPLAVVNGEEFAANDKKTVKLRNRSVLVHCLTVGENEVTVEADGQPLTLERGQEKTVP